MAREIDINGVWYLQFTSDAVVTHRTLKALKNSNITLEPWHHDVPTPFGLIFIDGIESYEKLLGSIYVQLKWKSCRIIVLNFSSAKLKSELVFKLLNTGVEYYFECSDSETQFDFLLERVLRWQKVETLINAPFIKKLIIGESPLIKRLLRDIVEVSIFSDVSILIQGERGTGKELVARLVNNLSRQGNADLVLVDCTTIRPELSGSEFFGHERGAYTGADQSREGAFALANNGTLFLDEIGELPLTMQAELLRIIQEGVYKKIGSNIWKQSKFRLVSATNRELLDECDTGNFRKDLYDRVSMWKCFMPPLKERKEDIPFLINHFFKKKFNETVPDIEENVLTYLKDREYPGNIRELQGLINRLLLKYSGKGPITMGDIPETDRTGLLIFEQHWYESPAFANIISSAIDQGCNAKIIIDKVKSIITDLAVASGGNNKQMSTLLGKSERWIQMQKAKVRQF
jgi:transcriptional regulator with GAF, ATPase, and Fis domain